MSEKRKRDKLEYLRGYKIKKKEEAKMIKREKLERYYMGKEDVDVVAATLAPPSPCSALPSAPSSSPSRISGAQQRRFAGEASLLEANAQDRGRLYLRFTFCLSLSFSCFMRSSPS